MASLPTARTVRLIAIGLMAATALIMLTLQSIPTHHWDIQGGASEGGFEGTAGFWGFHEREGMLGHQTESWFGDHQEEDGTLEDGIASLRAAALLGLVALLGAVAATVLLLLDRRWIATGLAGATAIAAIVAANLHGSGIMTWANIHIDRGFGYGLAVTAGFTAVAGTILATLPAPALGVQGALREWAAEGAGATPGSRSAAKSATATKTNKSPAKAAPARAKKSPGKSPARAADGAFNIRAASAIALAVAALLLGAAQFLPWADISGSNGDASFAVEARTWEFEASGSSGGFGGSQTVSWYDGDMDGEDGVGLMRIGAPLLAFALTGVLVAAVMLALDAARAGAIVGVAGTAGAILATILLATGSADFFDGSADRGAALVLGILAIVIGTAGSFAALLPSRDVGLRERLGAPAA